MALMKKEHDLHALRQISKLFFDLGDVANTDTMELLIQVLPKREGIISPNKIFVSDVSVATGVIV